jgi:hypothetical protein
VTAAVIPYEAAVATAAARLNDALSGIRETALAGGPQAVAAQSSGLRNGLDPDYLAEAYLALPRGQQAARAA